MLRTLSLLTFIILVCSCDRKNKREIYFEQFLKKYKGVELPLVLRPCNMSIEGIQKLSDHDSLFMRPEMTPYCTFKINDDYIATISLDHADCLIPELTTWTKEGKKIDQQYVNIGYCGTGPGFECSEFMTIKKNFDIYNSDTISSVDLDSLWSEIPGTKKSYFVYRKGQLLKTGKIELSDRVEQNLGK